MRIQLSPRHSIAYGQDAVLQSASDRLRLSPCFLVGNAYSIPVPLDRLELVVTHNPDDDRDADMISSLPDDVPVAIHTHLQWSYLSPEQQENFRKCACRARLGICPAAFATEAMAATFGNMRWTTVHNGVDPARFRPTSSEERARFRGEHGIDPDDLLVIYVGRLEDAKGLQVLISLARNLPRGVTLVVQFLANANTSKVLRYQPLANRIKDANPDKVVLIPDTDLAAERPVRFADVLILPSLKEVAPLVVIEALMSGTPVISTDSTPFLRELMALGVGEEELRIVVLPENVRELPRHLLRLTEVDADRVAESTSSQIDSIRATPSLIDDACRERRAGRLRKMGFTVDDMISSFARLYSTLTDSAD